ncbi:metallophosphoesterase [Candidatus Bathyarchaeota archaeon]|nr:metallophosphoesterase [Candidatus Bathyarchaeota archaeon]
MKIALSADFHLGMRQFNIQQRWNDFLDAFVKVTRKAEQCNVDVYVIAGDVFHTHRPHPGVVRKFLKEISNLNCPIILIRGNHDSPQILFERYGGDVLHLIRDVSDTIYLDKRNPIYEIGNTCFIGSGYVSFQADREIRKLVQSVETDAETKIGVFHQLLDYPGVPEERAEVSRGFLKSLGLDYILMGHYHVAYSEKGLFNSGSPEYWAFDQAEQIEVNLDNGEETVKPAKKRGFYIIETDNGKGEFVEIKPARPMYCITYETSNFNKTIHLPKIKEHLEKYNIKGAMVKSIIQGRHEFGRMNLSKNIVLDKPLIHRTATMLTPSNVLPNKINTIKAQTQYLLERGIVKSEAHKIAEWMEHNKEKLATMQSRLLLQALREVLEEHKD